MAESGQVIKDVEGHMLQARPQGKLQTLAAWGDFDGASVKIQAGFADGGGVIQWLDVTSLDTQGLTNLSVRANYLRLVVEGAGDDTNISWWFG